MQFLCKFSPGECFDLIIIKNVLKKKCALKIGQIGPAIIMCCHSYDLNIDRYCSFYAALEHLGLIHSKISINFHHPLDAFPRSLLFRAFFIGFKFHPNSQEAFKILWPFILASIHAIFVFCNLCDCAKLQTWVNWTRAFDSWIGSLRKEVKRLMR